MNSTPYQEFRTTSTHFLFDLLRRTIAQEYKLVDDVHWLIIQARHRCESNDNDEASLFSILDQVLEPAHQRAAIEALLDELQGRIACAPEATTNESPTTQGETQ